MASLGLAASFAININMEVIMSASIALTVHMNILALCLVAGIGLLGRPVSPKTRGAELIHRFCSDQECSKGEVQLLPLPANFKEGFEHVNAHYSKG